jgi:acrylyl-CoA reductase (NADPH)
MFKALLLEQVDGKTLARVQDVEEANLPAGEVLLAVHYSSLNYKDGLAITGKGPIVRHWPMIPGIDLVGEVLESADERFAPGDRVFSTGWGVGENHWGGMATRARLKADWLLLLPETLSERQAMQIGTAGLTAMLCVMALEEAGVSPEQGEVLVTGASGGVGSVAVSLLAQLDYPVVAVTGRAGNHDYLMALGASRILTRDEWAGPAKPLDKQLWAGAIDTVGSQMLAKVISQVKYNGAVAACGLAGGADLPSSVMPFILRNVRLQGVDSVQCPLTRRAEAWQRLGELLPASFYEQACQEVNLQGAIVAAEAITQGQITGRVLVRCEA